MNPSQNVAGGPPSTERVLKHFREINGILLVDKEKGWTSHDVCAFIRSRFSLSKVGHAGTLDPMATGLLVVLLGKSTKRSNALSASDKQYEGVIRLGIETDSYDLQGKVIAERDWGNVTEEMIHASFQQFKGQIEQKPPMVSAIKQNGVRLYKLARAGKTVDRASRLVTVYEFNIEKMALPQIYFHASVSKGTYLRTLVHDLGQGLGCGAILQDLRRIRVGHYDLERSVSIAKLKQIDIDQFSGLVLESGLTGFQA